MSPPLIFLYIKLCKCDWPTDTLLKYSIERLMQELKTNLRPYMCTIDTRILFQYALAIKCVLPYFQNNFSLLIKAYFEECSGCLK